VLVANPSNLVRALKQETTTIPIVMLTPADPVRNGLVNSLARPEGNVTGVAFFGAEVGGKRVELLKEIVPHLRRLALVASEYQDSKAAQTLEETITISASRLGFAWQRFRPVVASDYDEVFARIATEHFDAALISPDPLTQQNAARIIELALRHRIPTVGASTAWAKGGLLLGYGQDDRWGLARGAEYIDKILRGAKPSDLPVEQATEVELAINMKTVALGKARERRIRDESVKLLKGVQPVKVRPGQSLAGRPVASVASRRATGGCEAYTARKQAARVQLRHLI
jgi:putative ABC transport system substrate-binding protein